MRKYTIYETETGRITRSGTCQDEAFDLQAQLGEEILDGAVSSATHYVLAGVPTPRPSMGVSVDKTTVVEGELTTFSNVPMGTKALVDRNAAFVNDGALGLTFDTSGKYVIKMLCFPYLDYEVVIICS
jgi:hypothetical protein